VVVKYLVQKKGGNAQHIACFNAEYPDRNTQDVILSIHNDKGVHCEEIFVRK
jgi:hypothetical protein